MIPKTMTALRLNAPNDFEIVEADVPEVRPYEVLCEVESVAICGTDPHIINGDFPGFWPKEFPLIPGHEWAGTIVKLDELAAKMGWKEGDRVAGISHCGCGYCSMCLSGRFNLCLNYGHDELGHRQYGHYTQGAYADYMRTSIKSIARVPDGMDFNVAACMDPLSIALWVVKRSGLQPGEDILVNGTGPQGLFSIMIARAMGAGQVIASGSGFRLEVAEKLGAIPINYRTEDVVARTRELTGGWGAKRVVECAGTARGIQNAVAAVAKGGRVSMVGIPHEPVEMDVRRIVLDEIDVVGDRANPNTLEPAIAMAEQNDLDIAGLITHEYKLEDFATALDVFTGRKDNSLKVVIKPRW